MLDLQKVKETLDTLRDIPADTNAAGRDVLALLTDFLLDSKSRESPIHWFCHRADGLTIDAATFLLRLHAYDSDVVQRWRQYLIKCLRGCCGCVRGLEEAKINSRHTFFGAFAEETLAAFWDNFGKWQLEMIKNALMDAKLIPNTSTSRSLNDAPPAVIYQIFMNLDILRKPDILSIVHSFVPSTTAVTLPVDPPPPGIFLLAFDEDADSRRWARNHLKASKILVQDQLTGPYLMVLESIVDAVSAKRRTDISLSFSADVSVLWSGVSHILRILPSAYFVTAKARQLEIHRVVFGHLHDHGPHFVDVLRSLVVLCKRMLKDIWSEESTTTDYPQVIFDAIKDNPTYTELLLNSDPGSWLLSWYMDYLNTIWDFPVLGNVVAKMADFMCEELQHERFQELRPSVMVAAARLLASIDRKAREGGTPHQRGMSGNAIDIHCAVFTSVAFDRAHTIEKWSEARKAAREVVKNVLINDTKDLLDTIARLSRRLVGQQDTLTIPSLRKQMWRETYAALQGNDADGIAMVISVVASSAHVDRLTEKAFRGLIKKDDGHVVENVFKVVNEALDVFHAGFLDAVSKFANCTTSSAIVDLLRRPGMMKDIMALMLSPVDEIQVAAQTLVGQAFDVDDRQDCFRALIENLPQASLNGILNFLGVFIQYASLVPEACSLSKSIVRCMTDVIEVLCSSCGGLLRSQAFTEKKDDEPGAVGELPRWWKLMAQTISVIFKRTPTWSLYFGNEEMVVWMRDALIFGRDMLAQRRVIESAAVTCSADSSMTKPGRLSRIGRRMVEDLKEVLPELGRWLRLTDEELLHQSFALLETLLVCFKDTQVDPPEAGIAKLTKHVEDARMKDPKRPQTRLDSARLAKLESRLAAFQNEDDDDVQIISHTVRQKGKSDSDVEIVDGPKATHRKKLAPPPTKDLKMRFKPSKPMGSSSTQSISKFFTTTDDVKRPNSVIPKLQEQKDRSHPIPANLTRRKPLVGRAEDEKGKTRLTEASSSGDSSSDDHDSGGEGGLASLAKLQRTPKVKRPVERRQVKMMNFPTEKNAVMERLSRREDLRRTQLRLKPDISRFHRILLSWDFDHSGSEPPLPDTKPRYLQVPDKFNDHEQYQRVFEPLLMMECWAQIVKAKDEPGDNYPCTINSRQFVDDWLDLDISIQDQVKKGWMLMDADVVLLRHLDGKKSVLAKTQSYRAMPSGITATIRCTIGNRGDPGLQIQTSWRISKVLSLSTLHREYSTLVAVAYYDLFETILRPKLTKKPYLDRREIEQVMDKYGVNEPQAAAILGSMRVDGFSLIQGPPGTGKTSTICGLVQACLTKRSRPSTAITVGRSAGPVDKIIPPKILLCAPSNAAIDEVAHRLKDGMLSSGKQGICPKVVRIGADSSINIGVKDISLDSLVDQKLNQKQDSNRLPDETSNKIAVIRKELDSVKKRRQEQQEELDRTQNNTARTMTLQDEIRKLNQRRMTLTQQIDRLKDKQKSDSRTMDATRRKCRMEVLQEADVICGTLSGSGHEALQLEQFDFEMVIIDEAAQAIELSSLIPLKYKCRRCIMVGDPQQLPPTVLSLDACKYQYNQSLFVRFQKDHPEAVHLLSIQYRMHPDISRLPSAVFYSGKLLDGPNMDVKTKQPWHLHDKFGPYKFFNVSKGQEQTNNSHSLVNKVECQVAVALFNRLRLDFSAFDFDFKVGVISMYRAQIGELRRAFVQRFGQDIVGRVDFNTVDGFQGQEKDVIILSCVRAGPGLQSVGFLADVRRMNVALTRARSSLFILGHIPTLERSDPNWRQIIQDARSRAVMVDADMAYFTSRAPQPVEQAPPKSTKPITPIPEAPIPRDLINPRDMKPPPKRTRVASGSSMHVENHDADSVALQTPTTTMSSHSDQKRTASPDNAPQQPPKKKPPQVDGEGPKPKPRPPPPKRDKAAPSLFIPRKRPAPEGGSGGHPNKRR